MELLCIFILWGKFFWKPKHYIKIQLKLKESIEVTWFDLPKKWNRERDREYDVKNDFHVCMDFIARIASKIYVEMTSGRFI